MKKHLVSIVLVLAGVGIGVAAWAATTATTDRPDCPGKVVCPLTGELVCKDRCPLGTPTTAGAAGADCAADGTSTDSASASTLPPCCQQKNQ